MVVSQYSLAQVWDLRQLLHNKIKKQGGWTNAHTHLDRAYTINPTDLVLANATLHQKWALVDELKRESTTEEIYDRMAFALERQLAQGVTAIGSFIDVDEVVKDKAILAAQKIRERYQGDVTIKFINQTLKGVLSPNAREWFERAVDFVDIIGGLPGKDAGREAEHLDVLFDTARHHQKLVHVHVDQLNKPEERETELLITKVIQHGLQDRVTAIHGVSIAAQRKRYRHNLYRKMQQAGVGLIVCPTAWIDSRRTETLTPTHNSIAPVEEMLEYGLRVAVGTDNIADIYKPFTDGDMWTEIRFLLETCHYYDLDQLATLASHNGRRVLGIIDLHEPFYNPYQSYEENFRTGPVGPLVHTPQQQRTTEPQFEIFGQSLHTPFGIPAGPLLNGEYVAAAFKQGFDVCTYKTVRTREYKSHTAPNILAVKVDGDLTLEKAARPLVANYQYSAPLSITNSFSVPSQPVAWWQEDMAKAVQAAGVGQVMIGSFQGTKKDGGTVQEFIDDYILAAALVKETGAKILEANLSCPNEGVSELVCFDIPRVQSIVEGIKNEIGNVPLVLKLAYFRQQSELEKLIKAVGGMVEGLSVINTIPAAIVNEVGMPALPGDGRLYSGVCGAGIKWAGLEMVRRLVELRQIHDNTFKIFGVGGVMTEEDVFEYLRAGADIVMSATGAMWNPFLGQKVYDNIKYRTGEL